MGPGRRVENSDQITGELIDAHFQAERRARGLAESENNADRMNAQHSAGSERWRSPSAIVERARVVLGTIDLDPASEAEANETVRATRFITKEQNGLETDWGFEPVSVFLNPPGGNRKAGIKSLVIPFWKRLLLQRRVGLLNHAIFVGFSIEVMQMSQQVQLCVLDFPFCVPARRIQFDAPPDIKKSTPTHANVLVYVPGIINRSNLFESSFQDLGKVCRNEGWRL